MKRRPPPGSSRRVRHIAGNIRFTITNKAHRIVQCESFAEYKLALKLDRDRRVKDYINQADVIRWVDASGHKRSYTPDFIVWFQDELTAIYEVTIRHRRESKPSLKEREEIARAICNAKGWLYEVFTEDTLPNDSELANLLALKQFQPTSYRDPVAVDSIQSVLRSHGPLRAVHVVQTLQQGHNLTPGVIRSTLAHLIWHGEIQTDLQQLLVDELEFLPEVVLSLDGEA